MKKIKKSVRQQAEENVSVTKRSSGETEVLKKGSHPEHSRKHLEENTIGMSIGTTVNMDNYESLRADVWATVDLGDKSMEQGYAELFEVLDKTLKDTIEYYTE